jgi:branched-chain amino acid aminotransferase
MSQPHREPPDPLRPRTRRARPAPAPLSRGDTPGVRIEPAPTLRPLPSGELRFGQVFTDHMFRAEHSGRGFEDPRVIPFAPLALDPAAAGLHYGQTIFEGCKAFRGVDGKLRLFRLDRHTQRFARSAARLCMPAPDAALFREAVLALVRTDQRWVPEAPGTALYLRPTLIATEPFLGVRPARQYLFYVIASPVSAYYAEAGPLRLKIEERYTRAAPGGLGAIKAGANYAASLRAAEEARAEGFAQVLWTDALAHSAIEEAGTMNVFVHIGDEVLTPPLRGTILAGVTRESVITLLTRWGHKVRERAVTADELLEARRTGRLREMFGTGTGAGIAAIGELGWRGERIVVGDGGEGHLARRLQPTLREIQTGLCPDDDGWMTEV